MKDVVQAMVIILLLLIGAFVLLWLYVRHVAKVAKMERKADRQDIEELQKFICDQRKTATELTCQLASARYEAGELLEDLRALEKKGKLSAVDIEYIKDKVRALNRATQERG